MKVASMTDTGRGTHPLQCRRTLDFWSLRGGARTTDIILGDAKGSVSYSKAERSRSSRSRKGGSTSADS